MGQGPPYRIHYATDYDARGRLTAYDVSTDGVTYGEQFGDGLLLFPDHCVRREYSDSTGKYRMTYRRDGGCLQPEVDFFVYYTRAPIVTEYESDAAGRIISVDKDGDTTTYAYTDATGALPAITETRPDGSQTFIYLDPSGAMSRVAHTDATGLAVADYDITARDLKGRITHIEEHVIDDVAKDGVRDDQVEYTYGDGHLPANQLGDGPDKLYWFFIRDLGEFGLSPATLPGDPNRLVRERRFNNDSNDDAVVIKYDQEYFFDAGGNRLVMRESSPDGTVVALTRYNYFHAALLDPVTGALPGTPDTASELVMDYLGKGQNKLLSTQRFTFDPQSPTQVLSIDVAEYRYGMAGEDDADDMVSKTEKRYDSDGSGGWFLMTSAQTGYSYDRGQVSKVTYIAYDECPDTCGSCDGSCEDRVVVEDWREEYAHDIWGRRVAKVHCVADSPLFCEKLTIFYDYDGMSRRVLAERSNAALVQATAEDRFDATYTYGPMGVIQRTAESGDIDLTNNYSHYYLADALGGHSTMLVDQDQDESTPRELQFAVHDSFGVDVGGGMMATGRNAWRGVEGSVTDDAPALVEMGARSYAPELGRFVQADVMPVASLSSQGMNRYAYAENDPITFSDPTGFFVGILAGALFGVGLAIGVIIGNIVADGTLSPLAELFFVVFLGGILSGIVGKNCNLAFSALAKQLIDFLIAGAIGAGVFGSLLMRSFFSVLGAAFVAGLAVGFLFGVLLAENDRKDNDGIERPDWDGRSNAPRFAVRALI